MTTAPTSPNPDPSTHAYRRFLVWFCLAALSLYPLPFFLIRAPHFERWSGTAFGSILEWGATLQHADADIVLFGDSSALYGIDPHQLSRALNLSALNLPNTLTSLVVTQDQPLRTYLAHNTPPRLIVFYFSAWDLDYAHTNVDFPTNEGDEMMLRHGSAHDILHYYAAHPTEYLVYPFKFFRYENASSLRALLHPAAGPAPMQLSRGHLDFPDFASLHSPCHFPKSLLTSKPTIATAQALIARYATPQTRVLVYLAPIPGCEGATFYTSDSYAALHAAPPRVLDPRLFAADGNFVHPSPASVPATTGQLAQAIAAALAKPESQP